MQKLLTFFQEEISMYLPYFKIEILISCYIIDVQTALNLSRVYVIRQSSRSGCFICLLFFCFFFFFNKKG